MLFSPQMFIFGNRRRSNSMANPLLPGLAWHEQEKLYTRLRQYNEGRPSYKETGAYLVVLPRPGHSNYTLWIYSPLPGRQSIFYLHELAPDAEESLRMASSWCYYSSRRLLVVEYNAKRWSQSSSSSLVASNISTLGATLVATKAEAMSFRTSPRMKGTRPLMKVALHDRESDDLSQRSPGM